jgi:TIR domain
MTFKCACFISYPHNAGKSVDKFVNRLKEELQDRVAQFVTDPIATDHDFMTGADFNKAIAQKICESACLVVVYMPVYQRKTFCLQEYIAMERLQQERYQVLKNDLSGQFGMILPLVYTGEEQKIPMWISKHINYKNISKFTISDPVIVFDQPDFKEWLVDVANMIDSLYNAFQAAAVNPCTTCGSYVLPDETDPDIANRLNIPKVAPETFR